VCELKRRGKMEEKGEGDRAATKRRGEEKKRKDEEKKRESGLNAWERGRNKEDKKRKKEREWKVWAGKWGLII
jgi:hypothetical protein